MILMYSKSSMNEAAVESPSETTLVMSYLDDTSVEDKVFTWVLTIATRVHCCNDLYMSH